LVEQGDFRLVGNAGNVVEEEELAFTTCSQSKVWKKDVGFSQWFFDGNNLRRDMVNLVKWST
jgi:hypothetical protein